MCGGIGAVTSPSPLEDWEDCLRTRASWMRRSRELRRVITLRSLSMAVNSDYIIQPVIVSKGFVDFPYRSPPSISTPETILSCVTYRTHFPQFPREISMESLKDSRSVTRWSRKTRREIVVGAFVQCCFEGFGEGILKSGCAGARCGVFWESWKGRRWRRWRVGRDFCWLGGRCHHVLEV